MILATIYCMGRPIVTLHIKSLPHGGYSKIPFLINYVDSIKVWGLRPQTPPLTMSGDLLLIKITLEWYGGFSHPGDSSSGSAAIGLHKE